MQTAPERQRTMKTKANESNATPGISRRGFLKTSAAAASGPLVAGLTIERAAFAAGNDTIKVALVGCGGRGSGAAAQALSTRGPVKLWAMADLFADRLEASLLNLMRSRQATYDREMPEGLGAKIEVPPERRFVGFDSYKAAIDSGADVVILATHQHFRPMHYEYAVRQGKHVFMEKPIALDAPGVRQVLAANEEAKKKNLKVAVGLHNRHSLRVQETVNRLKGGAIGPILLMRCYSNRQVFARESLPRPPQMTEMEYQLRNPYHFVWLCGDYLVDTMVHYFDIYNWVKGDHPVSAQGQGGRTFYQPTQQGDEFDHHFVEFTYADGSKLFAQLRRMLGCWSEESVNADGPKGHAMITPRAQIEGETAWRFSGASANPYQVELDVLFDAIRRDKPHNEVEYAAVATMTGILGRMASYSGQMIEWEKALNSQVRLGPAKYAFDAEPPVVAGADGRYPIALPGVSKVI